MQKLYLNSGASMFYWETWESDGIITVHEDVLGRSGELSYIPQSREVAGGA